MQAILNGLSTNNSSEIAEYWPKVIKVERLKREKYCKGEEDR